ncbi:hypothetical protein Syun_018300 [Stephania yunnanensis]|uniref:Uncharacterized protein n=1 Tax=Stephania yunnanensis TaxID=152371 RepID=A0AAP0NVP3_9MAGN
MDNTPTFGDGMHQDTIVGVGKSSIQEGEEIPKIDNSVKHESLAKQNPNHDLEEH